MYNTSGCVKNQLNIFTHFDTILEYDRQMDMGLIIWGGLAKNCTFSK